MDLFSLRLTKYRKSFRALLLITFGVLTSCKKDNKIKTYQDFRDITYGAKPRNKLDLFVPGKSKTNAPLIIFIHGGGWVGGDKTQIEPILMPFLNKGLAVASINYSYADDENNFVQINEDIETAVNFLFRESTTYNYSSTGLGMLGYSAGGHLSLLHSYQHQNIKAVASVSGLANLCDPFYTDSINSINSFISKYIGGTYSDTSKLWELNSPYIYCNHSRTPTYIISGVSDNIVNPQDAKKLHVRLDSLAIPNVFKEYNGNHELFFHLNTSECEEMADWFLENLR